MDDNPLYVNGKQVRPSTRSELAKWMDDFGSRVGSGVRTYFAYPGHIWTVSYRADGKRVEQLTQ